MSLKIINPVSSIVAKYIVQRVIGKNAKNVCISGRKSRSKLEMEWPLSRCFFVQNKTRHKGGFTFITGCPGCCLDLIADSVA